MTITPGVGAPERWAIIELAAEADIALGAALIRPALSEVFVGGHAVRLERRVIQVLVALTRARGEAVSHDEFIARCWEGVPVGDEAITWCIGRLRRLAEEEALGVFTIETLSSGGHRLMEGLAKPKSSPSRATPAGPSRRGSAPCLAVLPFANLSSSPQDELFAFGMVEDLIEAMSHGLTMRVFPVRLSPVFAPARPMILRPWLGYWGFSIFCAATFCGWMTPFESALGLRRCPAALSSGGGLSSGIGGIWRCCRET